jgi:peptidoglycan/xylan/chitin deacetylase (PgdA/CDA1 family)
MFLGLPPAWEAGELVRLETSQHVVALTFDGGGNDASATSVLAELRRTGTPVTFFLTGRFVRLYPRLARQMGANPAWTIANHTVDHPQMTRLSSAQVVWEIAEAERRIDAATRRVAKPLFRFPYGDRDARTLAIARRLGYVSVRWTVDTWGWMGRCCQTTGGVVRRVLDHLVPGEIVLMHLGSARDGATLDSRALPKVIAGIRERGYRFVTLASVRPRP